MQNRAAALEYGCMSFQIDQLTIAVLKGGPGSEREVSLASARSVAEALQGLGARVFEVDVAGADFELPEGIDLAYNLIHGTFGEDGEVQAELERRGVPYTGAGVASSRLAFDKAASKERFVDAGVPTPRSRVIELGGDPAPAPPLPLPMVAKPLREGSSVGVHIIREPGELPPALADLRRFGKEALVEEYIEGRELTVAILDDAALPVIHIRPRSGFYDMSNKYPWLNQGGGTDYFCPADLPDEVTKAVQQAALEAHRCLGVEVYSRVDLLLRESDLSAFVLEVNTIPGMTSSSLLPKAAAAAGIDFPALCAEIARLSLAEPRTPAGE